MAWQLIRAQLVLPLPGSWQYHQIYQIKKVKFVRVMCSVMHVHFIATVIVRSR